ncbi:hypothetical protein LINPERHAP2_LOCUS33054 [Linum perenne]
MQTLVVDKKIDPKGKFIPGAYNELERLMLVDKPECGIKADPNIILRKHPHCAKLNRVPFPLYDGLAFVSGKGRATGKSVVGVEELN